MATLLYYEALKVNGAPSGNNWYVANEATDENGKPYATLTLSRVRAKQFNTESEADAFNERLMRANSIVKPFKKMKQ